MPLIKIDLIKGRSETALRLLLDTCHEAVVEAFGVPLRDRYQIVTEHEPSRVAVEDTGLDIPRTAGFVLLHVFTSPRTLAEKEALYRLVVEKLGRACGVAPSDVMICVTPNTREDWSFGFGQAQFMTGEL